VSDTHFGHANILKFHNSHGVYVRPGFKDVHEMDEHMIERWNAVVRPQDHVYHLGDVAMVANALPLCKRLHGHKRLVRGNHDIFRTRLYLAAGFSEIYGMRVLNNTMLTHAPIHPDSLGRFRGNLHGHIHEKPSPAGPYYNVSVERINYTPITLEDAISRLPARVGEWAPPVYERDSI
jgi:calcineurin-like phosphoesterase family protein